MKRIICIILIVMLPVIALGEDLSSMSYGDLIALNHQVTAEIMNRPEWKEVTVPAGIWVVGTDIPEGEYSVKSADEYGASFKAYSDSSMKSYDFVVAPVGKYIFKSGMVIDINRAVIFAPPVLLGF